MNSEYLLQRGGIHFVAVGVAAASARDPYLVGGVHIEHVFEVFQAPRRRQEVPEVLHLGLPGRWPNGLQRFLLGG